MMKQIVVIQDSGDIYALDEYGELYTAVWPGGTADPVGWRHVPMAIEYQQAEVEPIPESGKPF